MDSSRKVWTPSTYSSHSKILKWCRSYKESCYWQRRFTSSCLISSSEGIQIVQLVLVRCQKRVSIVVPPVNFEKIYMYRMYLIKWLIEQLYENRGQPLPEGRIVQTTESIMRRPLGPFSTKGLSQVKGCNNTGFYKKNQNLKNIKRASLPPNF